VVLAAAPTWFSENILVIAGVMIAAVAVFVIRSVQKIALRILLLGILAGALLFVYVERAPLEQCGRTCRCRIVTVDVHMPACKTELLPR
jgi:hypothetical protein